MSPAPKRPISARNYQLIQYLKFRGELKTDLNLLLECLKCQMDSPSAQKQALVTIYTVCQQNGDISNYFREIGGQLFVCNLALSSKHFGVKEASFFLLGALAESNVFCQQVLCKSDLLKELALSLSHESPLSLKRVAVYLLLALVTNNKDGQLLVTKTGCIDILLNLLRFPISHQSKIYENISSCYQFWMSVFSTLCACVNNPQNEENQRICTSIFKDINSWLQKHNCKDIIQPVCSFVGLTVANNSSAQEYFSAIGGLDTLAQMLMKLSDESLQNPSASESAVIVIKTLCSCIADNAALAAGLSKYNIVRKLLLLLSNCDLNTSNKLCIILTLGHCTVAAECGSSTNWMAVFSTCEDCQPTQKPLRSVDGKKFVQRMKKMRKLNIGVELKSLEDHIREEQCEEHRLHFLQSNGLPQMIQLLSEFQSEELSKAVTFVLQSCKQVTENLSLGLVNNIDGGRAKFPRQTSPYPNLMIYWKIAEEILHKIHKIDSQFCECTGVVEDQEMTFTANVDVNEEACLKNQELQRQEVFPNKPHGGASHPAEIVNQTRVSKNISENRMIQSCSGPAATQSYFGVNTAGTTDVPKSFGVESKRRPISRQPALIKINKKSSDNPFPYVKEASSDFQPFAKKYTVPNASELLKNNANLCSGCVAAGSTIDSKNCCQLLTFCPSKCYWHKFLLESEGKYKQKLRRLLRNSENSFYEDFSLTPLQKILPDDNSAVSRCGLYEEASSFVLSPQRCKWYRD
ncbi:telomere repeats-binding bouquet formation protein 1 [Polypterus senegalus]|uniref:telomere repeats-binding bouquet formation protein 1 n=1 Tax=Polypterus senegalus TaxID=55291 RepID=UPI0019625328|nr:telomere repeats-binding bouquet formation protein 1 [Polypterus senegalus]